MQASRWTVDIRTRKEIIVVKKISKRWLKHSSGDSFVHLIKIVDQKRREHKLSECDFPLSDWNKIKEGSEIELSFRESLISSRVLHHKIAKKAAAP